MDQSLVCVSFTCPRPGERSCSDHLAINKAKADFFGLAMADGCSESFWGGDWANTLCQGLVKSIKYPDCSQNPNLLRNLILANVPDIRFRHNPQAQSRREEQFLEDGDFSTILLAAITLEAGRMYASAAAIGDTCIFVYEPDGPLRRFPVKNEVGLNEAPDLVWSKPDREAIEKSSLTMDAWQALHPDALVMLATDQMSRFILRMVECCHIETLFELLARVVRGNCLLPEILQLVPTGKHIQHSDDLALCLCTSNVLNKNLGSKFSELRDAILENPD